MTHGGLLSPLLFSPYANDTPTASSVKLTVATSRCLLLLLGYLKAYLGRLEVWLRDRKIATNVFAKTARGVQEL
jgi:hypothetical protein